MEKQQELEKRLDKLVKNVDRQGVHKSVKELAEIVQALLFAPTDIIDEQPEKNDDAASNNDKID